MKVERDVREPALVVGQFLAFLAQLNLQRAVGRVHRREDLQAVLDKALLHLTQGVLVRLGRLKLDPGPAQSNLLEEEQLVVADAGGDAVGQLGVLRRARQGPTCVMQPTG